MSPDAVYEFPGATMMLYVAIVALLNLGLGYALAVMLQRDRKKLALAAGDDLDTQRRVDD